MMIPNDFSPSMSLCLSVCLSLYVSLYFSLCHFLSVSLKQWQADTQTALPNSLCETFVSGAQSGTTSFTNSLIREMHVWPCQVVMQLPLSIISPTSCVPFPFPLAQTCSHVDTQTYRHADMQHNCLQKCWSMCVCVSWKMKPHSSMQLNEQMNDLPMCKSTSYTHFRLRRQKLIKAYPWLRRQQESGRATQNKVHHSKLRKWLIKLGTHVGVCAAAIINS